MAKAPGEAVLSGGWLPRQWTQTGPFGPTFLHRIKQMNPDGSFCEAAMMEQKIKQDIHIGANIREVRRQRGLKQTELVRLLQLDGVPMTREGENRAGRAAHPGVPAQGNQERPEHHLRPAAGIMRPALSEDSFSSTTPFYLLQG